MLSEHLLHPNNTIPAAEFEAAFVEFCNLSKPHALMELHAVYLASRKSSIGGADKILDFGIVRRMLFMAK